MGHRGLIGFGAGVLVTLAAVLVVLYLVVADQRQAARLASVTLSRALAREVRVDRITQLGPGRVVMRGVALPQAGGWPVTVEAESVEATGPLTSLAGGGRGEKRGKSENERGSELHCGPPRTSPIGPFCSPTAISTTTSVVRPSSAARIVWRVG